MFVQFMFHVHPRSFRPFWSPFLFVWMALWILSDLNFCVHGLSLLIMAFHEHWSSEVFVHVLFITVQGRSTYTLDAVLVRLNSVPALKLGVHGLINSVHDRSSRIGHCSYWFRLFSWTFHTIWTPTVPVRLDSETVLY